MPKKDGDYSISESGNWNVASDFSKYKIMKPLFLADQYSETAIFGSLDMAEELAPYFNVNIARIKGFRRLVNILLLLINNVKFAMKLGKSREKMEEISKKLKRVEKILPTLYKTIYDQVRKKKEIKIIEDKYSKVLEGVLDIKSEINEHLNKHDLIFTHTEDFDPRKFKEKTFEDVTKRG